MAVAHVRCARSTDEGLLCAAAQHGRARPHTARISCGGAPRQAPTLRVATCLCARDTLFRSLVATLLTRLCISLCGAANDRFAPLAMARGSLGSGHPSGIGPDGKRDCLHMCYGPDGGPFQLVPRLLLHLAISGQLSLSSRPRGRCVARSQHGAITRCYGHEIARLARRTTRNAERCSCEDRWTHCASSAAVQCPRARAHEPSSSGPHSAARPSHQARRSQVG